MNTRCMQVAILASVFTIGGPALGIAQSSQTKSDTYTWNGELVALDTTAKTVTREVSRCISRGDFGAEALQGRRPCLDCLVGDP